MNEATASKLPPVALGWPQGTTGWNLAGSFPDYAPDQGYSNSDTYPLLALDFDGDGKTDLARVGGTAISFYKAHGDGAPFTWAGSIEDFSPTQGYTNATTHPLLALDVDGDGKTDIARVSGNDVKVYRSNGNGSFTWVGSLADFSPAQGYTDAKSYPIVALDVNGDGKTDIGRVGGTGMSFYRSDGTGTFTWDSGFQQYSPGQGYTDANTHPLLVADWNGDGKMDVVRVSGNDISSYRSNGDGTWTYAWALPDFSPAQGYSDAYTFPIVVGDWNGDGKADLGRVGPTYVTFYRSNGDGTWTSAGSIADLAPAQGFSNDGTFPLLAMDWNGDGKTDLARVGTWATHFYRANGDGTWTSAGTQNIFSQGQGYADTAVHPIFILDWNGDGKMDVGRVAPNGLYYARETFPVPDLLTSIANGIGGMTTVAYTPSPQLPTPQTQLPFPVHVVTSLTTNDGNGHVATTSLTYEGGFYHLGKRDFRGFRYGKITGQAGPNAEQAITETWFHQGQGLDTSPDDPTINAEAYTKGTPYETRVSSGVGGAIGPLLTNTTTRYVADTDGLAPYFTPAYQVETTIYNNGLPGKQTRTIFAHYDIYGNVEQEDQYGDLSDLSDNRTITRGFAYNTGLWIVGLPVSETIYQGIPAGTQMAQTVFYYDGTEGCASGSGSPTPSKGHLTRLVRWLSGGTSPETWMGYDPIYGNPTCTRDPNGHTTTMTYDSSNTFARTVTGPTPSSLQTTTHYYGVDGQATDKGLYGQVKSVTDANTASRTTEYDALGRVTKVINPDSFWTTTEYLNLGTVGSQHVFTNNSLSLQSWTYVDGLGRSYWVTRTGPGTQLVVTQTEYNVRGQVTRTSLPYFAGDSPPGWTTFTYDPLGRVTQTQYPDSSITTTCYQDRVTVAIDRKQHRLRHTRDAFGRLSTVEEYTGTFSTCDPGALTPYATTLYAFDVLGNLRYVTDVKGNQTEMRYDTLSRKTWMHDPDMSTATTNWTYAYTPGGQLQQQTDAKGQTIYFLYDERNRRRQKDYGTQKPLGSGNVVYTYDGSGYNRLGRLTTVQDSSGTATFYYDSMGRIIRTDKVVSGTTDTTQSTYDGLGRVTSVTYPDTSVVSYAYTGPLTDKVYEGTTTYAQWAGYNALGQPASVTYSNGVVTTYTYAHAGNPTCSAVTFRLCTLNTAKSGTTLQNLTYLFDAEGNVQTLTDPLDGNQTFVYDDLDRVTNATGPYGTLAYEYDQIGNLTLNSQIGTYAYSDSGTSSVRPHAVCATDASVCGSGSQYTYDNNGNMVTGGGRTLAWDYENRPSSVVVGGETTSYVYDGDGGRVKKIVGGMTTTYIGKLYECENTSCTKVIWAEGRRIIMKQVSNSALTFYHPDHLGSTSVVTDAAGVQQQGLTYYPYGATRTTSGSANVPYKYTGKEMDASTGLYFYEARYYDAALARFISADTLVPRPNDPQELNRYSYAGNNPLKYTDPTGHLNIGKFFERAFGDVGTTIVGAVVGFSTGCYVCGAAIMSQSESGRYTLSAAIIAVTVTAAVVCTAGTGGGCAPFAGAAVGSVAGGTLGGYHASERGGDISQGILFGTATGAATGAVAGYVGGHAPPFGKFSGSLGFAKWVGLKSAAGTITGTGYGAIHGYGGGKGSLTDMIRQATSGGITGAFTGPLESFFFEGLSRWIETDFVASPPTWIHDSLGDSELGPIPSNPVKDLHNILGLAIGDTFREVLYESAKHTALEIFPEKLIHEEGREN